MIRRLLLTSSVLAAAILATAVFHPSSLAAQIKGVVLNAQGNPIEGAEVEAWDKDKKIASRFTDKTGAFDFPKEIASRTDRLVASRLGFQTLTKKVPSGPGEYELRLSEEPVALEGLVVETERDICLAKEEKKARQLWKRARSRYHQAMDTLGIATYLATVDSVLPREKIGPLGIPTKMLEQSASSSQQRFYWGREVQRNGYAFHVRRTKNGVNFDSWSYAPLQEGFAPHFVDEVFGKLHEFHIDQEFNGGWILAFCPRNDDADKPSIRGTMMVRPDTTVAWVEWLFRTPEPNESAGGRIFLTAPKGSMEAFPLPTESLFWRRLPDGRYHETHLRFESWRIAPGDSVPFLPKRK